MSNDTKIPFYQNVAKGGKKKPASSRSAHSSGAPHNGAEKRTKSPAHDDAQQFRAQSRPLRERKPEKPFSFRIESTLFGAPNAESMRLLNSFSDVVQSVRPLNSKQVQELPYSVRDLSHQLTDERSARRRGYMNAQAELSAYIRYFQWWNLYRLTALFCGFGENAFSFLKDGDCILDIGSGPLTVPIALWLSRPDLRQKKLTVYVLDMSQSALSVGNDLFLSIAAQTACEPWHIVRVKGELGTEIRQKAALVVCANMFNELLQTQHILIEESVKQYSQVLLSYCAENTAVLLVEPGVPRGGRFMSLMRDAFVRKGFSLNAPCPHCSECPMPGTKNAKWCHFVLDTASAPKKLMQLSVAAGLPKERAVLSFVFAKRGIVLNESASSAASESSCLSAVVTSDVIKLPYGNSGRYACSALGLLLLTGAKAASLVSGTKIAVDLHGTTAESLAVDEKTGARCIPLC